MSTINNDNNSIFSDLMIKYERLLNDYTIKLFYDGLDDKDYRVIKIYLHEIHRINCMYSNSQLIQIEQELRNIFEELDCLFRYDTLGKLICEETSIVHAVFTNNKLDRIRFYSYDSFMFLCQFHREFTPSMGVTSDKGLFYCYGCHTTGNIIDYIMQYENLLYKEAVGLLARVYLIDLDYNVIAEDDALVYKYRGVLLSDEFRKLLDVSHDRFIKNYDITSGMGTVEQKYQKIIDTIERVRRGEHIKYVNQQDKPKKLVYNLYDMFDETR